MLVVVGHRAIGEVLVDRLLRTLEREHRFVDLDAERHAGGAFRVGGEFNVLQFAKDALLDLALVLEDVLVFVFGDGVVEEVLDAGGKRRPERLHLGRNLDTVDVELEGDFRLDHKLALVGGGRVEGARRAGVDAQADLAIAPVDERLLVKGAGRVRRHDVDGRGVLLAQHLDARVPDRHRRAQGAVEVAALRRDEGGVRAGVVGAGGAVDDEDEQQSDKDGPDDCGDLKHRQVPTRHAIPIGGLRLAFPPDPHNWHSPVFPDCCAANSSGSRMTSAQYPQQDPARLHGY